MTFDPATYEPLPRVESRYGMMVPELRDPEWLQTALDYPMTHAAIGDLLGCSQSQVTKKAKQLGCETKPYGWERACEDPRLNDAEWLRRNYVDIGRTLKSIANELGCAQDTLRARFADFGIETRGRRKRTVVDVDEWVTYPDRSVGPLTKDRICEYVGQFYNVPAEDVGWRDGRAPERVDHARRVAMWLCELLLNWPTGRIREEFNATSHNTVSKSMRTLDRYMKSCPAFGMELKRITQDVQDRVR